ncbi:MAG: carboxypeptidase-like regulatory domain-containing protein [Chitinophagaceae bacterium]
MNYYNRYRRIFLLFGIMLLFALSSFAQVQGVVVDSKGLGIPNSIITATDTARNFVDTVQSDNRGFYEFKGLMPGNYSIEAKAAGFRPAVIKNIGLTKDDTGALKGELDMYRGKRIDITLLPAKAP